MIEGFLLGVGGAVFAVVLLKFGYVVLGAKLQQSLPFFPLVVEPMVLLKLYIMVVCIGVMIGVLGTYISVSRSLKVSLNTV